MHFFASGPQTSAALADPSERIRPSGVERLTISSSTCIIAALLPNFKLNTTRIFGGDDPFFKAFHGKRDGRPA